MRISQMAALTDIVLGDAEALARAYYEIAIARLVDFETEAARQRCAVAVHAAGMATDPAGFGKAYARIAGQSDTGGEHVPSPLSLRSHPIASCGTDGGHASAIMPVCPDCGSELIVRDASARWDKSAQHWTLAAVLDGDFCDVCNADGDDLARWVPIPAGAAGALGPKDAAA